KYRDGVDEAAAVRLAVDALYDAADDDSATGGPDLTRRIWPIVMSATDEGVRTLADDEIGAVVQAVVDDRMTQPGG
ncbi:MAG TPA: proteasome subunit beta, partial [Mycobacteriales bacterium]|nr:proteasome subunit beta [Mycobacteriales bacterium]